MLIPTLDVSHRCASCANYSRDGLPNFYCAIHPAGVGVDAGTRNCCPDWEPADFSPILHAIATTLSIHSRIQDQNWRIVQLVQPPKQATYAVVLVDKQIRIWALYQWHLYNATAPNPDLVVEEWIDFGRSLHSDAPYVIWTDGINGETELCLPEPLFYPPSPIEVHLHTKLPIPC